MSKNLSLRSVLFLGAATAAALSVSSAYAAETTETVIVTGSRIPQAGLISSSPVQSIGTQEMKFKGSPAVENLLRDLPAVFNDGDNSATNNASNGLATIDLHDLGNIRTLVLVDGKRLSPADYLGAVDLNTIPGGIVDRVEVLTGGASSVYGADAVAGVVNLVLKKDFQGVSADASYTAPTDYTDGGISTVGFIMGVSVPDGRGNITVYGGYQNRQPIYQGNRPWSAFALTSIDYTSCSASARAAHFGFCPGGSSGIPEGRLSAGAGGGNMFTTSRTLVPYDGHLYNYAKINYMQTPNTHWDFGATGHYQFSPMLDIYTRLTFADNSAVSQLAEVPVNQTFSTNYGNPLMSAQERDLIFPAGGSLTATPTGPGGTYLASDTATFNLRRRLVENGPRATHDDHQMFQIVLGAKGELNSNWSYDISAQYGRTLWTRNLTGDASGTKIQQALLATGTLANPVCTDTSNGCVPLDIFGGAGAITKAQNDFITVSLFATAVSQQTDVQASLTGSLPVQSPWASRPVAVAFGSEYRMEQAGFAPDSCLAVTGCSVGFGASPPVSGHYSVIEGFGEVHIPLIENAPFADALELDGSVRFSAYKNVTATSFKGGGSWQPNDSVRMRASFNRAVREANVNELFAPDIQSAPGGADPCAAEGSVLGYTPTQALCVASGVPASEYLSANLNCFGQCTSKLSGNKDLKPETGDTLSFGFVFTPTFLSGFTGSVDYYNIVVHDAIFAPPFQALIDACFNPAFNPTQSFNVPACRLVHRDSLGTVVSATGYVNQGRQNIGYLKTQGIDLQLTYQNDATLFGLDPSYGAFSADLVGTYLIKTSLKNSDILPEEVCTGQYSTNCGAPAARWKHSLRLTWFSADSDISVSGRWRFINATRFEDFVLGKVSDPLQKGITPASYFDISGTWSVLQGVELRGGVNNVMNKNPPIVDGSHAGNANVDSGNTFPGTYDAIGRTYFLGLSVKY